MMIEEGSDCIVEADLRLSLTLSLTNVDKISSGRRFVAARLLLNDRAFTDRYEPERSEIH